MRVQPGLLGLLAAAPLHRPPCRLSVFPDSEPAAEEPSGNFDGPNPQAVTGFWTIYDELAMEDSMNRAARLEPDGPNSMMSASIVLRADGFTSRGSDFTTGRWHVEPQEERRRLSMTLEARAQQEEIRYDGLLVKLDTSGGGMGGSMGGMGALAQQLADGTAAGLSAPPPTELRVVGQARRYKVGGEGEPELLKRTAFSMIKLAVDRRTLTPTIKPFSQPLDPDEVRRQQEEQRELDVAETAELRELLDLVRERKVADPENWQDAFTVPTEGEGGGGGEEEEEGESDSD